MGVRTFDYRNPNGTVTDAVAKATLKARLFQREIVDGTVRTIAKFNIKLVNGQASAVLSDTAPNQAWVIVEPPAIAGPKTLFKQISGDGPITDAPDVDPSTLAPLNPLPPSAQEILSEAATARDDAQGHAQDALVSADDASGFADDAEGFRDEAESFAQDAAASVANLDPDVAANINDTDSETRTALNSTIATVGNEHYIQLADADNYVAKSAGGFDELDAHRAVALRTWARAFANRDAAPAVVLALGDSVVEGASSTTPEKRWIDLVASRLMQRAPCVGGNPAGGRSYIPTKYISPSVLFPAATLVGGTNWTQFGAGQRSHRYNAAGTATFAFTGTSARIHYAKGGSAAGFTYTVDGGSAVPVSWSAKPANDPNDGYVVNITGLSAGAHTVVVTWASGQYYLNGLEVFNGDELKGVRVIDAGHGGWRADSVVSNSTASKYLSQTVAAFQPALVISEFAINEYKDGTTPAAYKVAMVEMMEQVRVGCTRPPSFLLFLPYKPNIATPAHPWEEYAAVLQEIAAENPAATFIDMSKRLPNVSGDTLGVYADTLHPNDIGASMIADVVVQELLPR